MGGSAEAAVLAERVLPYHSLCLAGLRGLLVFMPVVSDPAGSVLAWRRGGGFPK